MHFAQLGDCVMQCCVSVPVLKITFNSLTLNPERGCVSAVHGGRNS